MKIFFIRLILRDLRVLRGESYFKCRHSIGVLRIASLLIKHSYPDDASVTRAKRRFPT